MTIFRRQIKHTHKFTYLFLYLSFSFQFLIFITFTERKETLTGGENCLPLDRGYNTIKHCDKTAKTKSTAAVCFSVLALLQLLHVPATLR